MAVHHSHGHGSTTTVVESDREGPATALIVLIALVIVGALIWFLAFSGVVFDRGGDTTINQNPPAQQDAPAVTNNNVNTNESPAPTGT
jgi:cytoskeletal protein RodZ